MKYDFETKEGHWVVTGYKDHYKMDRAMFKFQNLFNGNKQLGKITLNGIYSNFYTLSHNPL